MLFLTRRNVQNKTARGTTILFSQLGQSNWYIQYTVPGRDRIIQNKIKKQLISEMESLVHARRSFRIALMPPIHSLTATLTI